MTNTPNVPLLTGEQVAGNLGNSPAGKAVKGAFCESESCQGKAGAAIGILASAEGIFKGIKDSKDFCLNPAQAAGNTAFNFVKNGLNVFGGLGDLFFNGINQKSPLERMQDEVSQNNNDYQQYSQQYTQLFAQKQLEFDDHLVETLNTMNKANSVNTRFFFEMVSEKEDLDRIYIIFLFVYIIIIIIYILIE